MLAGKRWQDAAIVLIGLLMFVTPMVFGYAGVGGTVWGAGISAATAAYVLGGLIVVTGLIGLFFTQPRWWSGVELALGLLLFASPWLFGFAEATMFQWSAWILGLATAAVGASGFITGQRMPA